MLRSFKNTHRGLCCIKALFGPNPGFLAYICRYARLKTQNLVSKTANSATKGGPAIFWEDSRALCCIKALLTSICLLSAWLLLGLAPQGLCAQGPWEQNFQAGNQAYAQDRFADAQDFYEKALSLRVARGLYYNLASAYYHQGALGQAILSLERALVLDPNNSDVQHNLGNLRRTQNLERPQRPFLERYGRLTSPRMWTYGLLAGFWLFALLGLLPFPGRNLLRLLCLLVFLSSLVGLVGYYGLIKEAIVLEDLPLRVAPASTSEVYRTLPEGLSLRIERTHGDSAFVCLPSGGFGWVQRSALGAVLAS